MRSPGSARRSQPLLIVVILLLVCALAQILWDGFARGRWFTIGTLADAMICFSMILLYRSASRRSRG